MSEGLYVISVGNLANFPVRLLKFYGGADKSVARPGRKQAAVTEDFDFHISYL